MCAFMTPIVKQNYNLYGTKHQRNPPTTSLSVHNRSRSHPGANISGPSLSASTLMPPANSAGCAVKRHTSAGPIPYGPTRSIAANQDTVAKRTTSPEVTSPSTSGGGGGLSSHPPRACSNPRNAASTSALYIKQCRDRAAAKMSTGGLMPDGPEGENPKRDIRSTGAHSGGDSSAKSAKNFGNSIANMIRGSNRSGVDGNKLFAEKVSRSSCANNTAKIPNSEPVISSNNIPSSRDKNGNNNNVYNISANNDNNANNHNCNDISDHHNLTKTHSSNDNAVSVGDNNGNTTNCNGSRMGKLTLNDVRRSFSLNSSSKSSRLSKRKTTGLMSSNDSSDDDILNSNLTRNWNNKAVAGVGLRQGPGHHRGVSPRNNAPTASGDVNNPSSGFPVTAGGRKRESVGSVESESSAAEGSGSNNENAFGGADPGTNPVRRLFARLKRSHSERQHPPDQALTRTS